MWSGSSIVSYLLSNNHCIQLAGALVQGVLEVQINKRCSLHTDVATYAAFRDVVGVVHDVSGQAKVTDLDKFALTDQHVPGSEVTMNTLWRNHSKTKLYCLHILTIVPI